MRPIDAEKFDFISYVGTEGRADTFDAGVRWMLEQIDKAPTVDAVPVTFERFRSVCKFFAVGYDEDRKMEFTCRRKDMIPQGYSWGICDKWHCPYMKEEEE